MKKILFAISIVALLFTGCSDDDDNNDPVPVLDKELNGPVAGNVILDASVTYSLVGTLSVKDGATLTIPAGTTIKAKKGFASYVIVEQGGKIMANGTAAKPIIFTSAESNPKAGDWGGLILNGKAPISGGGTATCEMDASVVYGGDISDDNSGVLEFVELLYTGAQNSETVEHNGLTLDAVGSGTTINNIYVLKSADDAIEFFGGSVNVQNLLAVNCDDDCFDVTQGWNGTLDNAYGIWESDYTSTEADPRGIEADGNFDGNYPDNAGQSNFTMKNITIKNASSFVMTDGIKIRRGATATISNALLIGGTASDLIDMTDSKGDGNTASSINLTVEKSVYASHEIHANGAYPNVAIESGNTGASTAAFAWTGYNFPSESTVELNGSVVNEMTLNALFTYNLTGTLSVKDGGVLNIPAGTVIKAKKGFASYVIVEQGGKIMAKGTASEPIIFTSEEASPKAGDWGGLILNGKAPISGGGTATCEMDASVVYGGNVSDDNSGVLEFVELLYTGAQNSETVEHNGLTLDAVGSGTTINNIYVYKSADDAIEFFGGSVNVQNLLAVSCDDDCFDVTQGWNGTLDNAYGIWESDYTSTEADPRGIEADGNFDGNYPGDAGQSDFTMKNITIKNASGFEMTDGIKVRRGATATITNALMIGGTTTDIIDLTDGKGDGNTASSISLTVTNVTKSGNDIKANDTYTNVVIEAGNTGADTSVLGWTGFTF
ncbi:hypothetical protein QUH73_10935 [Labilibaculum sp. K2S]|uniref:hypothetical protein n=1 Tax=Labilibaculum sp. K2S TaxID=3056386 RepID=UPI0025A452F3|nr:hypothetical protein [Labilibaculum sp. K2S]MDM8160330.1 hypothetical protein [Labilibaculum sp. K2S]